MTYRSAAAPTVGRGRTRRLTMWVAALGGVATLSAGSVLALATASTPDSPYYLPGKVASCVVDEATNLHGDPLNYRYAEADRTTLEQKCSGDPATFKNDHDMPIY